MKRFQVKCRAQALYLSSRAAASKNNLVVFQNTNIFRDIQLKRCGDFQGEYELVKKPPPETFSLACLSLVDQADLSQKRYQVSRLVGSDGLQIIFFI